MKNTSYNFIFAVWLIGSLISVQTVQAALKTDPIKKVKSTKINFIENSWTAALKKARTEHKYIFVDAYASWCGPCKQLKNTTFNDKEAAAFFNKNFVNLSIDMEKGEGVNLADQWGVQEYPTLMIFDSSGKKVLTSTGFLQPQDLIKFGQQALKKSKS
ncbi:DUF255 domain-containing protein [Pedobacter frigidisoli]|uniref:DUF255 domain-containing protein n=1 Tax=Pedobacter frigidisoli TaxID=2530455 RepID=A0A4R0NZP0_9SPHI|nr:thioredoxin family protein [Pedobacter frigidisoli]TCD07655.1 DUF255 domain-containing protein [Pedobacter frigidisoli]